MTHPFNTMKKGNDEYLTPSWIYNPLGEFDLDPCAATKFPNRIAKKYFTKADDGLSQRWFGRVWLNPPYGRHIGDWVRRLEFHGNGIALTFARTDTKWFQEHVLAKADAVLFVGGRIHFCNSSAEKYKSNAGAPSVLIAYGRANAIALAECRIPGKFIYLRR